MIFLTLAPAGSGILCYFKDFFMMNTSHRFIVETRGQTVLSFVIQTCIPKFILGNMKKHENRNVQVCTWEDSRLWPGFFRSWNPYTRTCIPTHAFHVNHSSCRCGLMHTGQHLNIWCDQLSSLWPSWINLYCFDYCKTIVDNLAKILN